MSQTVFFAPADRRALVIPGLPADKNYTFEILAYRKVDGDVALGGQIISPAVTTNPYKPATNVAFDGDITGTIQGRSSLQVVLNLEAIASDSVLSTTEKPGLIIEYNRVSDLITKLDAKAASLGGLTTLRTAVTNAKNALDAYFATLTPAWNNTTQHTSINATTFRSNWDTLYSAIADLDTTISGQPGPQGQQGPSGAPGPAGFNTAVVLLFRRSATAPAKPTGTATHTFATGVTTGHGGGWTQNIPSGSDPLYVVTATATSVNTTDTIASAEWSSPVILAQNGTSGLNSATVFLYRRSASAPAVPSTTSTYTFATGALTGQNNSWTQAIPAANGQPLYVITATAASTGPTDTITAGEWAAPTVIVQDGQPGANGLTRITLSLYRRNATPPPTPDSPITYTIGTGAATGITNSWQRTPQPANGSPQYYTEATFHVPATQTTYVIQPSEFISARIGVQDGAPGIQGIQGPPGASGDSTYIWVAYADSANGVTNFTTGAAGNRAYLGIASNKTTATEGTNPADYTWSLIKGANGANGSPGAPGAAGTPSYVHIAYANSADGVTDFDLANSVGRSYIGVYTDSIVADSTNPADYTWSLIKGEDGVSPISVSPASISLSFSANAAGIITPSDQLPRTVRLTVMQGNTDLSEDAGTTYTLSQGNGLSASMVGTNARDFRINTVSATSGSTSIIVSRAGQVVATIPVTTSRSSSGTSSSDRIFIIGPFNNIPTTYSEAFSTGWQAFEFSGARTLSLYAEVFATDISDNWFGKWQESILNTSTGVWGAPTDLFAEEQASSGEEDTFDDFGGIDTEFYPASLYSTKTRSVTASVRRYRFLVRRTTGSIINIDVSNGFIGVAS